MRNKLAKRFRAIGTSRRSYRQMKRAWSHNLSCPGTYTGPNVPVATNLPTNNTRTVWANTNPILDLRPLHNAVMHAALNKEPDFIMRMHRDRHKIGSLPRMQIPTAIMALQR